MIQTIRRLLIGKPLHNQELAHERLPKWKALSIFSSDALSSVAYGPEQIMLTLVGVSGVMAYGYMGPIAISILVLLGIVALSYVQVAKANPSGGGAYAVTKKNLGEMPSLIVAGAVFADYVLTAAVSVAAGTDAIVSAFPGLAGHDVIIDLSVLFIVLMLVNLRGVRESSDAFVLPTYAFLFGIVSLIVVGLYKAVFLAPEFIPVASMAKEPMDWAMLFLILRGFANGCSSMTGVEAIADSVPMFKAPESRNATITTYWMAGILGVMFLGIAFLIMHYHIMPVPDVTALSQLAENVFGRNGAYFYIQITTMLVLYLAANTAYNGLPILLSIIARDGYLPRYLATRGERLTYSNGIILLTVAAAALIVIFNGRIDHLISLYAIGVFISFTMAQTSMVLHWKKEKGSYWLLRAFLNGMGALSTGIVVIVITVTKFMYGAWIILLFIPLMICMFKAIRRHYDAMAKQLHLPLEKSRTEQEIAAVKARHLVIVPVATPTSVVYETIKYAKVISDNIVAVNIASDEEAERKVREKWDAWNPGIELVILQSPYRLLMNPLLQYIEQRANAKNQNDYITVLIPEFETKKWWHRFLHNQSGWILRMTLIFFRKNIIVTTVPFHLNE
jgi:amino acid transporter